jgi:type VI secretion system protein ImpL
MWGKDSLGNRQQTPEELKNVENNRRFLRDQYFKEYAEHWMNFLQSIKYEPFAGLPEAVKAFEALSDPGNTPVELILESVAEQTRLDAGIIQNLADKAGNKLGFGSERNYLERQFAAIHGIEQGDAAYGDLNSVIGQYSAVLSDLETLASESEAQVAEYAVQVIEPHSGAIPTALRSIRSSLSRLDNVTRRNLFEQPVLLAWGNILAISREHLNDLWLSEVYQPFQNDLARYYPFDRNGNDAPVEDMVFFFNGSDGRLHSFLENELYKFVNPNFTPKTWEGQGIGISAPAQNALRKAKAIGQGLGIQNGGAPAVEFWITPQLPEPQGPIHQTTLIVDGKPLIYRMGAQFETDFVWPGKQGFPTSSLEVLTASNTHKPFGTKEGVWGWFKLLQNARIENSSSSRFWLIFRVKSNNEQFFVIKYLLRTTGSRNPFSDAEFFNFNCPRKLI